MQEEFDLHELAVEDALHGNQRPKIEEYGDSLFVVMHTVEVDARELRVGEIDVFVAPNYVLSVRKRTKRGFADVRARCEREPELLRHGSGFVLYCLMDAVVDRYFPILDLLETEFEAIEDQIFGGGLARRNIESLYALKQRLMVLRHATGPLADGIGKLYGGRVPQVCVGTQEYFRDVYDHLSRINQTIDSLRESVTTAMSVSVSLIQLQENEMMNRGDLRHELRAHAGAEVAARLPARDRRDGRDRRLALLPVPQGGLAVAARYCAVQPPSTTRLVPVTSEAPGEARNTTAAATSSGRPMRPSGMRP
jgi:magnesium transporter